MPDEAVRFFETYFCGLTGYKSPFPWQRALFDRLASGDVPERVNLPTASGKTSVMAVWLVSLGWLAQQAHSDVRIPRRIVWVVNRRVVVDQATDEAEGLVRCLDGSISGLKPLVDALRQLSVSGQQGAPVVVVSTLRGEKADNREWSLDPSRPAIIVGTVDMVGSRLLFSGYGDGRWWRPSHAGLIGHDTLLVNDESHLTPAFAALIEEVHRLQAAQVCPTRPFRSMLVSATLRDPTETAFPENLNEDCRHPEFARRLQSAKRLRLHMVADRKQHAEKLLSLACESEGEGKRTLVYVRSPDDARKLALSIGRQVGGANVCLLTGAMRGLERDGLLEDPVFQRFLAKQPAPEAAACWLVSTSAGEVGINIDSDRLVSDLDTADHLIQRFGRLNRFGHDQGQAHIACIQGEETSVKATEPDLTELAKRATMEYLQRLPADDPRGLDISPKILFENVPPAEALSPPPSIPPLLPWLLEAWSLTSLGFSDWPTRPEVAGWLHGGQEDEPPQTAIAWRDDIPDLTSGRAAPEDCEEVIERYPVLAHERLQEPTRAIMKKLAALAQRRVDTVLVIAADGSVRCLPLREVAGDERLLRYATVVLPPGLGRIDHGMFDAEGTSPTDCPFDVADRSGVVLRARYRAVFHDPRWSLAPLGVEEQAEPLHLPALRPEVLKEFADRLGLHLSWEVPLMDAAEVDCEAEPHEFLLYFGPLNSETVARGGLGGPMPLQNHLSAVAETARALAERLGLPDDFVRALTLAGQLHDGGKARTVWQEAAGNVDPQRPVAKPSAHRFQANRLGGYRHELGSILDAEEALPAELEAEIRDLVLHLIASHHGWARPHFLPRAFDRDSIRRSRQAVLECIQRFNRLQDRFGPWGLAYLEAIFKAADAIASGACVEQPAYA